MSDLSIVTQRAVEMLRLEYCGAQPRYVDGVNVGWGFPALVKDSKYAYFPDIDYGDKTVSAWQCRNHLSRLLYMAAALGDAEGEKLWEILAAIDFWVDNNFINPNWVAQQDRHAQHARSDLPFARRKARGRAARKVPWHYLARLDFS